jgi:hypothetical protein
MKRMAWLLGVLLLMTACHTPKKPPKQSYNVDPDTVWETILVTPEGVHYGWDAAGTVKHDLFRTFWLQRRSANSPYLYEKLQATINCRDKESMWLMRTVVQNNEVIAIQTEGQLEGWADRPRQSVFLKWRAIEAGSLEEKTADKVCQATVKRK